MSGSRVRAMQVSLSSTSTTRAPPAAKGLGHLEPHVAGSHHDHVTAAAGARLVEQALAVFEGLHAVDPLGVAAGQVWADRAGAGADQQLVERHADGSFVVEVVHRERPVAEVDAHHLVLHAHVDALVGPELVGGAGHEV